MTSESPLPPRSAIERSPIAHCVLQEETITYANPAMERLFDADPASIEGSSFPDHVAPRDRELVAEALANADDVAGGDDPITVQFDLDRTADAPPSSVTTPSSSRASGSSARGPTNGRSSARSGTSRTGSAATRNWSASERCSTPCSTTSRCPSTSRTGRAATSASVRPCSVRTPIATSRVRRGNATFTPRISSARRTSTSTARTLPRGGRPGPGRHGVRGVGGRRGRRVDDQPRGNDLHVDDEGAAVRRCRRCRRHRRCDDGRHRPAELRA